ncbi:hypothetical protein GCM10009634_80980 [Saccharothrix xinjiangensis]
MPHGAGFIFNEYVILCRMAEPSPGATASRSDSERRRFLRRVCAVTGSRQVSWNVVKEPRREPRGS